MKINIYIGNPTKCQFISSINHLDIHILRFTLQGWWESNTNEQTYESEWHHIIQILRFTLDLQISKKRFACKLNYIIGPCGQMKYSH
jgi:hypothetical protein